MDEKKSKISKIFTVTLNVLTYVFFALCIFALIVSVSAKKDKDGAVNIFGSQARIVVSNSMEKCDQTDVSEYEIKDIPIKSMVFIELVPEDKEEAKAWYQTLKVGDVLTFRYVYNRQVTITHRIQNIEEIEGGRIFTLVGDNKDSDANTLTQKINTTLESSPNYIIGKVTGQSHFLGVLITAVKSPVGIICIIIVPCLIIMGVEIFRIASYFTAKKRQKGREEQAQKDAELAELKKQLERLQQNMQSKEVQPSEGVEVGEK